MRDPAGKKPKIVFLGIGDKTFAVLIDRRDPRGPVSMMAHSADVCQCNSRTPPAVSLMFTPASVFDTGSSRTVTSRDQPPSYVRLFAKENGYLKFWTRLLESVSGGHMESGF